MRNNLAGGKLLILVGTLGASQGLRGGLEASLCIVARLCNAIGLPTARSDRFVAYHRTHACLIRASSPCFSNIAILVPRMNNTPPRVSLTRRTVVGDDREASFHQEIMTNLDTELEEELLLLRTGRTHDGSPNKKQPATKTALWYSSPQTLNASQVPPSPPTISLDDLASPSPGTFVVMFLAHGRVFFYCRGARGVQRDGEDRCEGTGGLPLGTPIEVAYRKVGCHGYMLRHRTRFAVW